LPNLFDMVIVGYHDDSSLDATRETIREDPEARIKVQHFW